MGKKIKGVPKQISKEKRPLYTFLEYVARYSYMKYSVELGGYDTWDMRFYWEKRAKLPLALLICVRESNTSKGHVPSLARLYRGDSYTYFLDMHHAAWMTAGADTARTLFNAWRLHVLPQRELPDYLKKGYVKGPKWQLTQQR